MVYFVSGWREEELLQKALAAYFVNASNPDESARLAKMLSRALTCIEKQGKKEKVTARPRD